MNWRGAYTLFYKELLRFHKVALQTLLAPMITALLYLLVFSHALSAHVQALPGVAYTSFLIPGLIMMSVIQNAFANSSSSLIQSKITGNLLFILVAPLSSLEFFLAFVAAAVVRGLLVGLGIYAVTLPFIALPVHSVGLLFAFAFLGSALLGALGLIAGMWAEKFDQLAGFQNFVVMPLSFLSGVFYSIHSLPAFWQHLSRINPFFYVIDGFRYGFFGRSDMNPWASLMVVGVALALVSAASLHLLARGYKIRD